MLVEKIARYKKTMRLKFSDDLSEQEYQSFQSSRGRSTGIYSLLALATICLTLAFMEFWILGIHSSLPMYGFLLASVFSLLVVFFNILSDSKSFLRLRILLPAALALLVLLSSVYFEGYRLYHIVEITLLALWLGSLNILSVRFAALVNFLVFGLFVAIAYWKGADGIKLSGLLALLLAAFVLSVYLSYMMERLRRMMFLTCESMKDVYARQENWAYTLIDLDMALSGITDFKVLIERLMEHIRSVIQYDSFVLTSLDGKGPKPAPDQIDGTLFEQEDDTIWPEQLLGKLSQTRQATASAKYEEVKGWFGHTRQNFLHFRLDIPVFNDSTLQGVISLRRAASPFDDLDKTAGVSIASQAMMIFDRSRKASLMSAGLQQAVTATAPTPTPSPVKPPAEVSPLLKPDATLTDLEVTTDTTSSAPKVAKGSGGRDETVVPSAVVKKIQQETASARKTITLLSRENADHVAADRYRTAAVEGEPLSLLLVEVDGLSAIREKEGDPVAYKVFAGIVKYAFSKTDKERDVLGRYGQNGFSILLPRVDMNAAEKFAESLRQHVETSSYKTPYGDRKATLSVGVAAITDETGNYESMVKRADMALFVAKKNGRNCVKVRL